MMLVTFLNAKDGAVEATTSFGLTLTFKTPEQLAGVAKTLDFSNAYHSSSMDFADEYGFPFPSAAWDLVQRGLEMA